MLSVCIYRVMDARWSLESTKNERVARGAAESNSRFLSVLQTSQVKNWAVFRWFLPFFKEKENCTAA